MSPPLEGVRVVALEQAVAAPLCTRHLADLGATVVKVEPIGTGDFARHYERALSGTSAHFAWLNWGKRSVALNWKRPEGHEVLCRLVAGSDVLVSNLGPGVLDRVLPPEQRRRADLIECEIAAFDKHGPNRLRKGYDLLIQAEAGVIRATGTLEAPAKPGVSIADLSAGVYATIQVLAQLIGRGRTGDTDAQHVSMFDCLTEWMSPLLVEAKATGRAPEPTGVRHASITPYGPFPTVDGDVVLAVQNDGQWRRLCRMVLERDDMAHDEDFATNEARCAHRDEVEATVAERIGRLTTGQAVAALEGADVPWAVLRTPREVVDHGELVARDRWQHVRLSNGSSGLVLRSALHRGASDAMGSEGRVPARGEDTRGVLVELGYTDADISRLDRLGVVECGQASVPGE